MRIRLGYVSISKSLNDLTASHTITYTNYQKETNPNKLQQLICLNLENLFQILIYNQKNNIHFYRITSNLIPLATKKELTFDYLNPYQHYYQKLSSIIQEANMRVDFHPSSYCILNSTKQEVVELAKDILEYHNHLLDQIGVKEKLILLHIGSNTFGKENSLSRFIHNFKTLPQHLQTSIAIENDDKIFNIEDCLFIAKQLKIPVVLDYHHHRCNPTIKPLETYLPQILNTWNDKIPKMHFSSPKSNKEYRHHHDYINVDEFIQFLSLLKPYSKDIDIMLEAKAKDEALFRLIRELKYKTTYHFLDETSFEL